MKPVLLWIAVILLLLVGLSVWRMHSAGPRLNVEPHAAKEIQKAKQR
jgi:hypothetical protein